MKKTICILPHKFGMGGPASFQASLVQAVTNKGYAVNHDPLDPATSVILVMGGIRDIQVLKKAQKNGVRIVQRLNGMNWVHRKKNTGIKHYLRAEINNMILSSIRKFANYVIYQSEFSRSWWNHVYGETNRPDTVIYNGVDLDYFSNSGFETPPNDLYRILVVEARYGGGYEQGLDSAIQMARLLNQRMSKKIELMIVGSVPDELKLKYSSTGVDINWKGVAKREEIPAIDRSAHVLFSADVNAACPNSVLEAMSCGLPVVGYDTGALPELISSSSGLTASYGADVWKLEPPDIHTLADAAQKVLMNQEQYRKGARQQAVKMFDIQHIAAQYLQVFFPQ